MKNALEVYGHRLNDRVVEDIRSWRNHPELSKLLQSLRSTSEPQRFLDHYAEAVVARYLLQKGCKLAVEVPTPNGRTADLQVSSEGFTFWAHIKRLNADEQTQTEINIQSRLQPLRRIPRPIILTACFDRVPTDAEMQQAYRELKRFVEMEPVGEKIVVTSASGNELGAFGIAGEHTGTHVQTVIRGTVKCVDDKARLYGKFSEAYKQFMPGGLNLILVTTGWSDDIEDFETALLGSTYEVWNGMPPDFRVIESGRKKDGFWSQNKHPQSAVAAWFNFGTKEDFVHFIVWCRQDHKIPHPVTNLFPNVRTATNFTA
ncbi:MAG TPA: hypothetical protein VMX13_15390 [Sedimentisphaerales bacterium]|nr:hypothetical protein [Sedimentisphaerales bacterium]